MDMLPEPSANPSRHGRILVVDDHQDMLQLLVQILEAEGYQARVANNGMEALWCVTHHPPDLILLDVRMPGMNGLEVARALKSHAATASIPIIIVSAADSPEDRIAGFAAGAVDFIGKPFVDRDVLARIDTHIQMSLVRNEVLQRYQQEAVAVPEDLPPTSSSRTGAGEILVVEDTPESMALLVDTLQQAGFAVREAPNGELALWSAVKHPPDLILLDMRMPGMNGTDVCLALKSETRTRHVPVIMMSAANDAALHAETQAAGALDFIAKPFDTDDLLTRIRSRLPLAQPPEAPPAAAGQSSGATADQILEEVLEVSPRATALLDAQGQVRYVNPAFSALTGKNLHELSPEFLQFLSQQRLNQTSALRRLLPGLSVSCNVHVARLLTDTATTTRFAHIIVLTEDEAGGQPVIAQDAPLFREFAAFTAPRSIYPGLESAIHVALEQGELRLLYQPIVDLNDLRPLALEALLRWQHPRYGLLLPADFLTVAEESGMILAIGRWVQDQAGQQLAHWQKTAQSCALAINISALQFWQDSLLQDMASLIERYALRPADLMIEVAAASLHEDLTQGIAVLHRLKALGVTLTLERCGADAWLRQALPHLPVDIVKLDPALLRSLAHAPFPTEGLHELIDLLHALEIRVTAHGIEDQRQLAMLRQCQCDTGQGYLLGKPASILQYFPTSSHA